MERRAERRDGASGGSHPTVARACVNCQRRKTRCHRGKAWNEPCSFCARTGKTCSFESPPDRTPLTRKNLEAAEARCARLEKLLRSLNPDVDIDLALKSSGAQNGGQADAGGDGEVDDAPPNHYDWHEVALSPEDEPGDDGNDGMAVFATGDTGYLGSSSGSQMLEEIGRSFVKVPSSHSQSPPGRQVQLRQTSLPESPKLPLSQVANQLIDAYFERYNTCYPVIHEETFREKLIARQTHGSLQSISWRVLYYMVLTIGHWVSSTEAEHAQAPYYTAARANLSLDMLESGKMEAIQAFLLMGNYLQKRDRTNTGYNFIGLACRMAYGLGLHRELQTEESVIDQEKRRRLFWTIYCFESGFNITTGRPPTLIDGFIDTRIPQNIDDKESSAPEADYPTSLSAIIAQAKLVQTAELVYREYLLARTAGGKMEYRAAETMERDLSLWRKSLPGYFAPEAEVPAWFQVPRAVVLWKEQNLRILLWRGTQMCHTFLPTRSTAASRCLDVAMQSIHDIAKFCSTHEGPFHQGLTWYATYFIIQATLILHVYGVSSNAPSWNGEEEGRQQDEWRHSMRTAYNCLGFLAQSNKSARRCLEILQRLGVQSQLLPQPSWNEGQSAPPTIGLGPVDSAQPPAQPPTASTEGQFQAGPAPEPNGPYDFQLPSDFGNHFDFDIGPDDPDFRMVLDEMSSDFIDNMPLDLLLGDWNA